MFVRVSGGANVMMFVRRAAFVLVYVGDVTAVMMMVYDFASVFLRVAFIDDFVDGASDDGHVNDDAFVFPETVRHYRINVGPSVQFSRCRSIYKSQFVLRKSYIDNRRSHVLSLFN